MGLAQPFSLFSLQEEKTGVGNSQELSRDLNLFLEDPFVLECCGYPDMYLQGNLYMLNGLD